MSAFRCSSALITVLSFALCAFLFANYGLFTLSITAFIIFFVAYAGVHDEFATALDRLLDTTIGATITLGIYGLWPTWERALLPSTTADLIEADRAYVHALLGSWFNGGTDRDAVAAARGRARLARTNTEASVQPNLGHQRRRPITSRSNALSAGRPPRCPLAADAGLAGRGADWSRGSALRFTRSRRLCCCLMIEWALRSAGARLDRRHISCLGELAWEVLREREQEEGPRARESPSMASSVCSSRFRSTSTATRWSTTCTRSMGLRQHRLAPVQRSLQRVRLCARAARA